MEATDATLVMQDGWPPVDPELWDEPGMHIVGMCTGPMRNIAERGATIALPHAGETIFPAPVQTQFVLVLEDGALRMEAYNPDRHGKIDDIPKMKTPPPILQEQLFGDSGTEEVSEGQQFGNERRKGASRKHWPPRFCPPARHNQLLPKLSRLYRYFDLLSMRRTLL